MASINLSDDLAFPYYDLCCEFNLTNPLLFTCTSLVGLGISNSFFCQEEDLKGKNRQRSVMEADTSALEDSRDPKRRQRKRVELAYLTETYVMKLQKTDTKRNLGHMTGIIDLEDQTGATVRELFEEDGLDTSRIKFNPLD